MERASATSYTAMHHTFTDMEFPGVAKVVGGRGGESTFLSFFFALKLLKAIGGKNESFAY